MIFNSWCSYSICTRIYTTFVKIELYVVVCDLVEFKLDFWLIQWEIFVKTVMNLSIAYWKGHYPLRENMK